MKRTTRRGAWAEDLFHEELKEVLPGLVFTSVSGARFGDGDLATPELYLDVKSSEGKELPRISAEDWQKCHFQAESLGKDHCFPIVNGSGALRGIVFPIELAKRALALLYPPRAEAAAVCNCLFGARQWNPNTRRCLTCGHLYRKD